MIIKTKYSVGELVSIVDEDGKELDVGVIDEISLDIGTDDRVINEMYYINGKWFLEEEVMSDGF